jgi:hypothetical protein
MTWDKSISLSQTMSTLPISVGLIFLHVSVSGFTLDEMPLSISLDLEAG